MPLILLTRPQEESEALAEQLEKRGIKTLIAPLLHIERVAYKLPEEKPDGIIITSRHAIYAVPENWHDVPFYVVGEATVKSLQETGAYQIAAQAPTVEALLPLLEGQQKLLYLSGEHISHEVPIAERVIVYRAKQAESLPENIRTALAYSEIDAVMLFSARTAKIFLSLCELITRLPSAICMSTHVADMLERKCESYIAAEPDQAGMITVLSQFLVARQSVHSDSRR